MLERLHTIARRGCLENGQRLHTSAVEILGESPHWNLPLPFPTRELQGPLLSLSSFLWALPLQNRADRVAQSLACVQEKHHTAGASRVAGPLTGRCSDWLAAPSRGGAGSVVGSESSLPRAACQAPACWFILAGACSRG